MMFSIPRNFAAFGLTFSLLLATAAVAQADDLIYAPPVVKYINLGTLGGTSSNTNGISADGSVVVGNGDTTGDAYADAFIVKNGTKIDLGTLGGVGSTAYGISADGTTVVGYGQNASNLLHAFRWKDGVMQDLGTLGGSYSLGISISANGNAITGYAYTPGNSSYHGFRWENGVMQDLGTLGGSNSTGLNISADGTTVVGNSFITGNTESHAYRWQGGSMIDLGTLGGSHSEAIGVSNDGGVVIGNAYIPGDAEQHGFRWENNTMQDLGTLGGNFSETIGLSSNGGVVIGNSTTSGGATHAYRSEGGPMIDLGTLGGTTSYVSAISADGKVIAGASQDASNGSALLFRWTQRTGMQSLKDILTQGGVNYSGWTMEDSGASYLSADGTYMAGTSSYNGNPRAFLMSFVVPGIITPEALNASLETTSAAAQQTASMATQQVGQSLFLARHINSFAAMQAPKNYSSSNDMASITPAAGGDEPPRKADRGIGLYSLGGFGIGQNNDFNNHDMNGTIGINARFTPSLTIGVGILGASSKTDLSFDGTSRTSAHGVSSVLSYEPEQNGLRLYGSAFVAGLNADRTRGYMNGAGLDFSRGKTDGLAYGAAAQAGWEFPQSPRASIMPYVDLQLSKTELDGYTETGGAFAASFTDQRSTSATSHLGIEQKYNFRPNIDLIGRLAWGHRLDDGGDAFTATSTGLTQSIGGGSDSDRNWGEATVGINWQTTERLHLSSEVSGRSGNTDEAAVRVTFGMGYSF